ncbi:Homoserine acetyltransferase [Colletotrichum higginsianum IMI 349063]|uniref:Homoserine acetyltransferase n=1 Tax=Colletotrichum higginsianum (strain IMI 349063) TaxID=759273 RepID=A0A1B7XQJ7_COLHI|nr:Homoserine acetyltransferase [Colletotrichum higginsianum IMI 349063]OBR02042.1 Homoserine acetyltransferase [Colletotrichum higginsianum IMI 349063]
MAQNQHQVHYFDLPNFTFTDGTTLSLARLAYLDINSAAPKVALIPTCFKGTLHSTLTFSSGVLQNHRIIVVALFGNGESSSPSNTTSFPASLDYRDCVRAQHALLSHLGINVVDVILGFSMGGQTTYHWAVMYPAMVRNAVIICSSARTSGHNRQFLEGPSAALENAVDYTGQPQDYAPRGVRAFGKAYSAWLTSAEWFDQHLYRNLGYDSLRAWDMDTTGPRCDGWYPNNLLVKLRMWQNGDVGVLTDGGGLDEALERIEARVLLMPCRTDQYFRPDASEREVKMLKRGSLKVIPSVWGHLAGAGSNPVDVEWMDEQITAFLQGAEAGEIA